MHRMTLGLSCVCCCGQCLGTAATVWKEHGPRLQTRSRLHSVENNRVHGCPFLLSSAWIPLEGRVSAGQCSKASLSIHIALWWKHMNVCGRSFSPFTQQCRQDPPAVQKQSRSCTSLFIHPNHLASMHLSTTDLHETSRAAPCCVVGSTVQVIPMRPSQLWNKKVNNEGTTQLNATKSDAVLLFWLQLTDRAGACNIIPD